MKPRAESLLHAMWMGPVGSLLLTVGTVLAVLWSEFAPVTVSFMALPGAGFVIAATAITAAEAFRQLQE